MEEKNWSTKIIQISTNITPLDENGEYMTYIFGLGEDGVLYKYDLRQAKWLMYK